MNADPCTWSALTERDNTGRCCCNCKYMKDIVAHPWNKNPDHQGSIRTVIGYGCNMPEFDSIVFFETEHNLCEMHTWRKSKV